MAEPPPAEGAFPAGRAVYKRKDRKMCSLFYTDRELIGEMRRLVQRADREVEMIEPGRDVRPTERALLLRQKDGALCLSAMKWGYPGPSGSGVVINARAESVTEKRMFAEGIRYHRAVVPVRRFYEWNREKERYTFQSRNGEILYLAGCFDIRDNEERFVILTTEANGSMRPVHDRMPLILKREQIQDWLGDWNAAERLLRQTPMELTRQAEYEQMTLFSV